MAVVQSINGPRLRELSRRVISATFQAPAESDQTERRGLINVSNNIERVVEDDGGGKTYRLDLSVRIDPDDETGYYVIDVKVSGIFEPVDVGPDSPDAEALVLSSGSACLYSYAAEIVSTLTEGGAFGRIALPLVEFTTEERVE